MKPALAVAAAAVSLSACGSTSAAPAPSPTKTPTPTATVVTTLPDLGGPGDNVRVLVPLTRGVGGRGFNGATYNGKELTIEFVCIGGGSFKIRYAGGFVGSTCDGALGQMSDSAVNFKVGSPTTFDLETNGRWEIRVTEAK